MAYHGDHSSCGGELRELHHEHRIDAFVFWPDGDDHERQVHAYAEIAGELRGG